MIDFFKTWLPSIIGYAEAIRDGTLRRAWQSGDRSQTSVYWSGELYEQVFGDLDADDVRWEMREKLDQHPRLVEALELFLHSLKRLDEWIEAHVDTDAWATGQSIPGSVSDIFASIEWTDVERDASDVIAAATDAGYSSGD